MAVGPHSVSGQGVAVRVHTWITPGQERPSPYAETPGKPKVRGVLPPPLPPATDKTDMEDGQGDPSLTSQGAKNMEHKGANLPRKHGRGR